MDIQSLDLKDLKEVLKGLNSYKDLSKKLGKRWKSLFSTISKWTHVYVVEYFPSVWKSYALEKSMHVFSGVFGVSPQKEEIKLVEKENISSGIKVYYDDNCVDLSFKSIENKLQK